MKLMVILSSVIAMLICALGCISASWIESIKSNKNLKDELKKSSNIMHSFSTYISKITEAMQERNKIDMEIKGAKDEKDAIDIANSIVDTNNKLSNNKNESTTSTKTSKRKSR